MTPDDEAFLSSLGSKIAEDVHWMMVRLDPVQNSVHEPGLLIADTRYTRMLRKVAAYWLAKLEKEADEDGD